MNFEQVVKRLEGHSPAVVAKETGLHRNTVRQIISGERDNINLRTLRKLIAYIEYQDGNPPRQS